MASREPQHQGTWTSVSANRGWRHRTSDRVDCPCPHSTPARPCTRRPTGRRGHGPPPGRRVAGECWARSRRCPFAPSASAARCIPSPRRSSRPA
eukprot:5042348-Prymnesium_polylepis.1